MHAVVVKVSISDVEGAQKELRETVVPRVSQLPGFVPGYWTRSDASGSNGRSMISVRVAGGRSNSCRANRRKRS